MIANTRMLIQDLLTTANKQFIIPIYQRPYTWTIEQCERLLDDIYKTAINKKPYFLGCIAYQEDKLTSINNSKLYLVDGQQRFTTIMLIAKALNLIAINTFSEKEKQASKLKYIIDETNKLIYVNNYNLKDELKLQTSYYDEQNLLAIMQCSKKEEIARNKTLNGNIIDNFIYIYENLYRQINNLAKDIVNDIFSGLLKLYIVEIKIDEEESAEEIFESINSLGVKLTAIDSIRNYLFMNNKNQQVLFETRWKPIQDELIGYENMDNFIMHYLVMKLRKNINKKDIYSAYIEYANSLKKENGEVNKEELLNDLYEVAKVYQPFLHSSANYNLTINNLMQEFRDLNQTTSYAFLLRVFLDHKNNLINDNELAKIVNFILVYVVRRLITGVPNNLLRPLMFGLYDKLFKKNNQNKEKYYETIYNNLVNSNKQCKIPNDNEVRNSLLTLDLYKNKKLCKSLLYRIENGRYLELIHESFVNFDDFNIEHIIPQDLTSEWEKELGNDSWKINDEYGNSIGNLTLTLKTQHVPNESFTTKRQYLLEQCTEFTNLNSMLKDFEHFNKENLLKRSNALIEKVIEEYGIEK